MQGDFFERLLRLLYPKHCLFCDEVLNYTHQGNFCEECFCESTWLTGQLCNQCGKPLERNRTDCCYDCAKSKHFFKQGRALWLYQENVRTALKRYKFEGRHRMHQAFADELLRYFNQNISWQIDLITSVPLHSEKLKKRGFNQAALISKRLGMLLGIKSNNYLLIRAKKTLAQKELVDSERILNVKDAFLLNERFAVEGLNILLIDDIYTTGATVNACSKVLKEAGAENVYFMSIAIGRGY